MRLVSCRACNVPIRVAARRCPFCDTVVRRAHAPVIAATALGIGLAASAGDAHAGTTTGTTGATDGTSTGSATDGGSGTSGSTTNNAPSTSGSGTGSTTTSTGPEGTGSGSDTDPAPIPAEPHYGTVACDVGDGDDPPAALAALGLLAFARRRRD